MLLTVAVIGPAHGLKGEARLEIRTDDPKGRLAPGSVLPVEPARDGAPRPTTLTVARLRHDGSRWFAAFQEAPDRTAVEALRGLRLVVDTDNEDKDPQDEGWYAHELVGLAAHACQRGEGGELVPGECLGEVSALEPGVAQDRLVVRTPAGQQVAVPFVAELVPVVDIDSGLVLLDPPGGLFPGHGSAQEVRP